MYKTTFTFSILSEEEIPPWMSMEKALQECETNDYVALWGDCESEFVNNQTMVELLYEAGCDPSFFGLNDDGEPLDDDYLLVGEHAK